MDFDGFFCLKIDHTSAAHAITTVMFFFFSYLPSFFVLYFLRLILFTKLKRHFFVFGDGTQIIGICSFNVFI